ncbi:GNAT family N-acetyltransferase [Solihabitans fulvus]|uniref:GNAT family N-acetyltransferase n=1 Tax=Solihabitans fulvus TaxID=1892852 RepID=UPI001CB76825|nr:GNAT family N-acetyltransferase [Solihabitans fulvus]
MDGVVVTDAPERARYEAHIDGVLAGFAEYRRSGDVLAIPHTEVDPSFGGRGVGSELVRQVMDDLRGRGLLVRPLCPFVAAWIEKNPDYADLLDPAYAADDLG